MSASIRWQLPHSFLTNSKNTNLPSRPALWIASSTLVAQIALPGPIGIDSDMRGEESEGAVAALGETAAVGFLRGAATGTCGSARAAKRTTGRRELKTNLRAMLWRKRSDGLRHSPGGVEERGAQGRN